MLGQNKWTPSTGLGPPRKSAAALQFVGGNAVAQSTACLCLRERCAPGPHVGCNTAASAGVS